jgi:predicted porin
MKKLLIASAALAMVAGTAHAQSSVSVYGVLDVGYTESKFSQAGTAASDFKSAKTTNTGNGDGALSTSRLGFRGTEDLGSGLKANFMLEWDLTDVGSGGGAKSAATTGQGRQDATLSARESWVGISDAKLGEVKLGRMVTASHGVIAGNLAGYANNITGSLYSAGPSGDFMAPQQISIRPHNVFADRLVTYISPRISGVQATAQYGENEISKNTDLAKGPNKSKFTDFSLTYVQGNLSLGAAQQKQSTNYNANLGADAAGDRTAAGALLNINQFYVDQVTVGTPTTRLSSGKLTYETTSYGGNYNFGVAQPFALRTEQKGSSETGEVFKRTATEIGVRVPVGAKLVGFASMMDGEFKYLQTEKMDISGYQLGALYNISKRTTAYVIAGKQENKGTGLDTGFKAKTTQTALGVRHSF